MSETMRTKLSQMSNTNKEVLLKAEAEQVKMTLNTDSELAMNLLMQRLTELYDNPIEASVRETVSNALDAVEEAHSGERPEVRITSPSNLSPVLIIKDNGVGMSYSDLKTVYSKYGASTKANNLDQIGAYGLGAKSPLAYGNEFTVTSVKEGQKTTIIVAREEMTNYIKIVSSEKTDEQSGTTVSIPVDSYNVREFCDEIDKYKKLPMDKDVELYIDDEKQNQDEYSLLADSVLIHRSRMNTHARVWIKTSEIIDVLVRVSNLDNAKNHLSLLIGGWAYDTPSARRGYRYGENNNSLVVELKAGVVDFNSSRDVIQDNEKAANFEKLLDDYFKSEKFTSDVVNAINKLPIDDFKRVTSKLLDTISQYEVNDGLGKFNMNKNYYGSGLQRDLYFDEITHKETGYNLNELMVGVPNDEKELAVICESKLSYKKSVNNSIMNNRGALATNNITEINRSIDAIFKKGSDSVDLSTLTIEMAKLISSGTNIYVTFITDVNEDDDLSFIKSNRKSIYKMRHKDADSSQYFSYLAITKNTKAEIEHMVKKAGYGDLLDIKVNTVDEVEEAYKVYRKTRTSKAKTKKIDKSLSTDLYVYSDVTKDIRYTTVDKVDSSTKNIIIVSKNSHVNKDSLAMIKAWYANKNKLNREDVSLYLSNGMHRIIDIEIIMELGEVMLHPDSDNAGTSNLYYEKVRGNYPGMNAVYNKSKNIRVDAFTRLLLGVTRQTSVSLISHLSDEVYKAKSIAEIAGYDLSEYDNTRLKEVLELGSESIVGDTSRYNSPKLDSDVLAHLKENLEGKDIDLVNNISALVDNNRVIENDEGLLEVDNYRSRLDMDRLDIKAVYDGKMSSIYTTMIKANVKAYLDFVNDMINQMSTIKF